MEPLNLEPKHKSWAAELDTCGCYTVIIVFLLGLFAESLVKLIQAARRM